MQEEKDLNSDPETKEIVDDITQGTGTIAIASVIITIVYFYFYSIQNNTKTERIIETSTMIPLFVLICTAVQGGHIMFAELRKKRYKAKGREEGKTERDAEWIEWAKNGKDPKKMPSVVNPVKPAAKLASNDK